LRPPISFDALLRRDKKSPDSSRNGSGNQHGTPSTQQHHNGYDGTSEQAQRPVEPAVKPMDVKIAQENNEKREKELRTSLQNVEVVAMSSTRQLDDTYYTILDKASLLRSTVANLQQLAEEAREMDALFHERSEKIEEDTRGLLSSFDNFNAQEKIITELVDKLKASKTETNQLNDRLEAARNRVEAYEQREKVKAANRRKRWGAIWGVLVGLLVLVVAFVVVRNRSEVGSRVHGVVETMDRLGSELRASVTALNPLPSHSEDPYLKRLFDEI
jgi:tetrahydromethanopterin S-methyltransferase subunit G